jgi:hypothetical protein
VSEFESVIRDKLVAGALPTQDCRMTWYGPGTGAVCVACDRPIGPGEVEVECDLGAGGVIRFHQRCHEYWIRQLREETTQ